MTRDEVGAVLETGDFRALVGIEENLEVEFKGSPYRLDDEGEKFELAKDASALANANGGVIVIGVRTERHAERFSDVAESVRPVPRELIDETRYVDVLTERVYPRISGLGVRFHPLAGNDERGLLAISVPPQDDLAKYFLVQRPIAEDGRVPGWMVGVAVRSFGRVDEQRIGELHALINRGLSISSRLDDLAVSVGVLHELLGDSQAAARESPADRLGDVLERRLREITDG